MLRDKIAVLVSQWAGSDDASRVPPATLADEIMKLIQDTVSVELREARKAINNDAAIFPQSA